MGLSPSEKGRCCIWRWKTITQGFSGGSPACLVWNVRIICIFATQAKTLNEGLDRQLEEFLKEHTDARLIIIDTLQKVVRSAGTGTAIPAIMRL